MFKVAAVAAFLLACSAGTAAEAATTLPAGSGEAFNNMQPSLVLSQFVQTDGYSPMGRQPPATFGFIGQVRTFAYPNSNFFSGAANGQALSRSDNPMLATLISPDGQGPIFLPDLVGSVTVGSPFPGFVDNSNYKSLQPSEMPAHDHELPGGGETALAGGHTPITNLQSTATLKYGIVTDGLYGAVADGRGALGQVIAYTGINSAPNGLLQADGRLLSVTQYPALFSLLGTTYGGDGTSTFALPNLTDRTAVGESAVGDDSRVQIARGEQAGSAIVELTEANLPAHDHDLSGGGSTGTTGDSQPFSNVQPSLGLRYLINIAGDYPPRDGPMGTSPYLGEIMTYAGTLLPAGWVLADGSLLSVRTYPALYALLGPTFGGDGRVTFALPDLRGRTVIGSGIKDGTIFNVGQIFGTSTVQLREANLPPHVHSFADAPVGGAVPEPSTWAMMLAGFGVVGFAMRRRQKVSTSVKFA